MSPRSASPTSASSDSPVDRLTAAVDHLADNVSVLRDILEDIREDLSWLTRNGVPHQDVAVRIDSLPLNPATWDWMRRVRLTEVRSRGGSTATDSAESREALSAMVDELVIRLAEPLGEIAQEQLNILLGVMESARREIENSIREGSGGAVNYPAIPTADTETPVPDSAAGGLDTPPPGSLF